MIVMILDVDIDRGMAWMSSQVMHNLMLIETLVVYYGRNIRSICT